MNRFIRHALLCLSLLSLLFLAILTPVSAQDDLTQQIDLPNGYVIFLPDDWQFSVDKDTGYNMIGDDRGTALVFNPLQVEDTLSLSPNYTGADVLVNAFLWIYGSRLRNTDIEMLDLNGRVGLAVEQQNEVDGQNYEEWLVAIEFGEGEVGLLYFFTPAELMGTQGELWREIAATFTTQAEIEAAAPETSTDAGGGECFVSTDSANTIQLRVGPGYNRSSVAFLPAGDSFAVLGANTADDGSAWFQLDKSEVAPNSAANELWVAREDVSEEGNCDAIGEVAAPPVVPIMNQPPPQTAGGEGGEAPPAAQPGALPNNGRWLLTYEPMYRNSCEGTETVNYSTEEELGDLTISQTVEVVDGGAALNVSGDRMILTAPGSYYGSFTFDDGTNAQFRLQVVSPTFMTGTMTSNAVFDGLACSATVGITMSFFR